MRVASNDIEGVVFVTGSDGETAVYGLLEGGGFDTLFTVREASGFPTIPPIFGGSDDPFASFRGAGAIAPAVMSPAIVSGDLYFLWERKVGEAPGWAPLKIDAEGTLSELPVWPDIEMPGVLNGFPLRETGTAWRDAYVALGIDPETNGAYFAVEGDGAPVRVSGEDAAPGFNNPDHVIEAGRSLYYFTDVVAPTGAFDSELWRVETLGAPELLFSDPGGGDPHDMASFAGSAWLSVRFISSRGHRSELWRYTEGAEQKIALPSEAASINGLQLRAVEERLFLWGTDSNVTGNTVVAYEITEDGRFLALRLGGLNEIGDITVAGGIIYVSARPIRGADFQLYRIERDGSATQLTGIGREISGLEAPWLQTVGDQVLFTGQRETGEAARDLLVALDRLGEVTAMEPPSLDGDGSGEILRVLPMVIETLDTLTGSAGDDTLEGSSRQDLVRAKAGDDLVLAKGGPDAVQAGQGDDTVEGGAGHDRVEGNNGADSLVGGDGRDTLEGGKQDDTLKGGAGADQLLEGVRFNALVGTFVETGEDGGADSLLGGAGDDLLMAGKGADYANGATGNDTVQGGAGADTVHGGSGQDLVSGDGGADFVTGGGGRDTLYGGGGRDTLKGGTGHDLILDQAPGGPVINPLGSSDVLEGGKGDDTLDGGLSGITASGFVPPSEINLGSITLEAVGDLYLFRRGDGEDLIQGFDPDVDLLALDPTLWQGTLRPTQVVRRYAEVTREGDLVFDFGRKRESITVEDIASRADLFDNLIFL